MVRARTHVHMPLCEHEQKPQSPAAELTPPQSSHLLHPGQTQEGQPTSQLHPQAVLQSVPSSEFLDRRFDAFNVEDLDAPTEMSALKKRRKESVGTLHISSN